MILFLIAGAVVVLAGLTVVGRKRGSCRRQFALQEALCSRKTSSGNLITCFIEVLVN